MTKMTTAYASITRQPHAHGQRAVQLAHRRFTLTRGGEVIAVDHRIVRRPVQCFADHLAHAIERGETGANGGRRIRGAARGIELREERRGRLIDLLGARLRETRVLYGTK